MCLAPRLFPTCELHFKSSGSHHIVGGVQRGEANMVVSVPNLGEFPAMAQEDVVRLAPFSPDSKTMFAQGCISGVVDLACDASSLSY